jgi:DNA-binding MarR family transcriptional regulator
MAQSGATGSRRKAAGNSDSIKYGPLANWIGFNLRMAQESAFSAFSHLSKEVGENPGRFATLTLIAQNPGISQTALSLANGRDKSSMTPVLEDLVRRGLVQRQRMRDDRRAYRLSLTPAGLKTLAKLTQAARSHERNLERVVGKKELARFLLTLRAISKEIG